MMKKIAILLSTLLPALLSGAAQERAAGFRRDLELLAAELPARHVHLFARIDRETFERQVEALSARLDSLDEAQFAVELMRLAASVGDEHTRIQPAGLFGHAVALQFEAFDEGVFVTVAAEEKLLFARLSAIDGIEVGEVLRSMRTLVPSGNESLFSTSLPYYLNSPFILYGLGIAASPERAAFTFETPEGDTLTAVLRPDPQAVPVRAPQTEKLRMFQGAGNYTYQYIPKEHVLYFNYRSCAEQPDRPFGDFNAKLFDTVARCKPQKLIVDLRRNGGGNSRILEPFLDSLRTIRLRGEGHLYVLIGPRTFSSALLNALTLKEEFGALLVGQPTSGSVNHYGEVRSFTLPSSGAAVNYSTRYFENRKGYDGPLRPDIGIGHSVENFRCGRDEALERIFEQPFDTKQETK